MSESPLNRNAGPIATIAGGLFAVAAVGLFFVMDRSDLVAMMTDPVFLVFNAAYAITFPLLLIALVALYWRQAGEAGLAGCRSSRGLVDPARPDGPAAPDPSRAGRRSRAAVANRPKQPLRSRTSRQ